MKRILFLSAIRPEPGCGASERTLSIYNALRKLGDVQLLIVPPSNIAIQPQAGESVVRLLDSTKDTRWYRRRRSYLLHDFRPDRRVAEAVALLHRQHGFDVFFGWKQTAVLGACYRLGPSYIDCDDVATDWWQLAPPPVNLVRRAANLLRRPAMTRSLARFKCVFVTKKSDVAKISHPNVQVLPCISTRPDTASVLKAGGNGLRMLFVGGLLWWPNREGLMRFIRRSLPSIRRRLPSAVLRVVGWQSETLRGHEGVDGVGYVADLTAEYRQSDVCICPIWHGSGATVKLAEAAALGQAIVATAFAARGYEGILEPGRDLLVADSDEELANCCVELLVDEQRRQRLACSARTVASTMLNQAAIDRIIEKAVGPSLHG